MSNAKDVTDATFEQEVLKADKPVLVDFWAEWCGPCRRMGPILDQIAAERGDSLKIVKVDVDKNDAKATELRVRGIPALFLFRGGIQIGETVGLQSKKDLDQWIDEALAAPQNATAPKPPQP